MTGPEPAVGLAKNVIRTGIRRWTEAQLDMAWRREPKAKQAHIFMRHWDRERTSYLIKLDRGALRKAIGVLTGHCRLRRHLHLLGGNSAAHIVFLSGGDRKKKSDLGISLSGSQGHRVDTSGGDPLLLQGRGVTSVGGMTRITCGRYNGP
ncbi:lian-aa1 retrotransposon protein [Lasius niger]|uniref:Lian-aa1 retrotransposon protein n=1 Tax=Lasius niger TaxID=67767 RepID=A0A0J7KC60_LASNI|nr:lian-aa1 retrotransposon protein [Lasius niger]